MLDWFNLQTQALVAVAAQFGGMGFFALLFVPMVFKFIDQEAAAHFMRQIFPIYYQVMACAAILPSLLLIPEQTYTVEVATLLAVASVFIFTTRFWAPKANEAEKKYASHSRNF